ncbi:Hsp20/alpha crystallin family protein [Stackebrandtia soli]|uniref:Hsp20/alpha crystallin family protein n=1 Tax=Stackebrandtia soli TaxID=1892856 RepID=UPI0039E76F09
MLVRYRQPWYLSSRVNSEFDQLIAEAFGNDNKNFKPAADVVTDGDDVVIKLAIAGVPADAVDVTLDGRKLTVTGERAESELADGDRYLARGLRYGAFRRGFTVPEGTTAEQISASLDNGVLSVRVAKVTAKTPTSTKIAIVDGEAKAELDVAAEAD